MLFRTQNNVPEIYVNKSRDFQLLGRLKDVVFGGVKYTIDSLNHTSNTMEMNATLLPLLKSKVGFFEYEELTEDELRYLLAGFPDLIKYKGSRKAIKKAIYLWFRVNRMDGKLVSIDINNEDYTIYININAKETDTKLLDEIFKYILPTGYRVEYRFASDNIFYNDYDFDQSYVGINVHNKINSNIRTLGRENDLQERLLGSVGLTEIATKEELEATQGELTISPDDIEAIEYPEDIQSANGGVTN
ncbi:MAG: hypothetical protein J6R47_04610 [Acholeplasmatales bacterium]|nr:hypothetical protein [Acholeplasmatales bacterium]